MGCGFSTEDTKASDEERILKASDGVTGKATETTVKFIYSEKATKFFEISTLILSYVVAVKRWRFRKMMWLSQNI